MTVPIVLLHHDEPKVLIRSVAAIAERTKFPHILFVIDNASPQTEETVLALQRITQLYSAIVIHNPKKTIGFTGSIWQCSTDPGQQYTQLNQ